ncbi:MAG: TetR/AcrR family transcriptional regulator [bacterium]|nr:TetR/AcrR family transcriptional regulator [bacterium]MCP4963983.1 TetR/AcrR family transcriptional regulator [bacterium]
MTGLRDRKKQEVRRRIISAAADLITASGLEATTMEDIAAAADVSVATVYNYFGSKSALLIAGVEDDTTGILLAGRAVLNDPGPDVVDAMQRLVRIYADDLLGWDPKLLRELFGAAFERLGGPELTVELAALDKQVLGQMVELLVQFVDDLGPGVQPQEAAMQVFSGFVLQLIMFVSLPDPSPVEIKTQIDRQIELAFTGLAPAANKKAKAK